MLSIQNPPPDPSCPLLGDQKISSQLIRTSSTDEQPTITITTQEVDHVPKFSIRDFVFAARNKDIKTNWPFAQKDLQLCLKHGVKEVLPPFQSSRSVRKHSSGVCSLDTSLLVKENINTSNGNPSGPSDHLRLCSSDDAPQYQKIAACVLDETSRKSEVESDFASTTTSNTQPDTDRSITGNRLSDDTTVGTGTSLEASVEVDAVGGVSTSTAHNTTKSKSQPLSKKCRLVVKFNTISDRSSKEDITADNMVMPDAMSSKVCPVCKTFSSSSNTTLNAHIDQCLSMESTSNLIPNTKLTTKYRIKPRRMRSMVDICATAPRCTLEELDRRNGSSWATDLSLPTQHTEDGTQRTKQRVSPAAHPEEVNDEGTVYIDANGTKLRILSKLNGLSSSSDVKEDHGIKKFQKSRSCSANKGRHPGPKHQKVLKLTLQSKALGSHKALTSKLRSSQCGLHEEAEINEIAEGHASELPIAEEDMKSSDSRTLRRSVCSKRSDLSEKTSIKDRNQTSEYRLPAKNTPINNEQTYIDGSYMEKSEFRKISVPLENSKFSGERCQRIGTSSYEAHINWKRSHGRKRVRNPIDGDDTNDNAERSLERAKRYSSQSSENCTSVHNRFVGKSSKYVTNDVATPSNKTAENLAALVEDACDYSTKPPSWGRRALSSKATRLSTSKKKALSVSPLSVRDSKTKVNKKCLTHKVHCIKGMGEENVVRPSEIKEQYVSVHNYTENHSETEEIFDKVSVGRSDVDEIGQEKRSQVILEYHNHNDGNTINLSVRASDDFTSEFDGLQSDREEVQYQVQGIVSEPCSTLAAEGTDGSSSRSTDPGFSEDDSPNTESGSLHSFKEYEVPLYGAESAMDLAEQSLSVGCKTFRTDEVGNYMRVVLDAKAGQGNSFSEIDPIPIPGPPGSFLPSSPGDAESEDFQGNSSLTSGRVLSSEDHQHDTADGNTSDSPNSAASVISNSAAAMSEKCSEHLSYLGSYAVDNTLRSGFLGASPKASMENEAGFPQTVKIGAGRNNFVGESFRVSIISTQKEYAKLKEDDHPCCCSRKEKVSRANNLESQLLKRRTMASMELPSVGKQISNSQNTGPNNLFRESDRFPLSHCSSSGSEKEVLPVMQPPPCSVPVKSSSEAAMKFPICGDPNSASPSASNPILRLMGKNLMVVKNDEDSSVQLRDVQLGALADSQNTKMQNLSWASPGILCKKDYNSSQNAIPQNSVSFDQRSCNSVGQHVDVRFSSDFRSQINCVRPLTPTEAQVSILPGSRMCSGQAASEMYEYRGDDNLPSQLSRSWSKLNGTSTYNVERVTRTPDQKRGSINPAANSFKEVIIIDDSPESEMDLATDDATYTKGVRDDRVLLAGISMAAAPDYNSRHANPYPYHQIQGHSPPSVLATMQNPVFHAPHSRQANALPVQWSCTSDIASVLQRGHFIASSSKTSQPRSAFYYSPSMS